MINKNLTIPDALAFLSPEDDDAYLAAYDFVSDNPFVEQERRLNELIQAGHATINDRGQTIDLERSEAITSIKLYEIENLRKIISGQYRDGNQYEYYKADDWNGLTNFLFLLDELIYNSVEHGSRFCKAGTVSIRLLATKKGVLITLMQPFLFPDSMPKEIDPNVDSRYTTNTPVPYVRGNGLNHVARSRHEINYIQLETGGAITLLLVRNANLTPEET